MTISKSGQVITLNYDKKTNYSVDYGATFKKADDNTVSITGNVVTSSDGTTFVGGIPTVNNVGGIQVTKIGKLENGIFIENV